MILPSIETPADLKAPERGATRRTVRGDQDVHRRHGHDDRRAPRLQSRRRRAHAGAAPGLRLPARRHPVGHRPSGLRAQAADRAPLRVQDAEAGGRDVRLSQPGRVRARLDREQPRLDRPVVRPRDRQRVRPAGHRRRAPGRRRGRRRRPDRRHGLRGPQQPRALAAPRRDRAERQRPLLRADGLAALPGPHGAAAQPHLHRGPGAPAPAPARAARPGRAGLLGRALADQRAARDGGAAHLLRGAGRALRRADRRP